MLVVTSSRLMARLNKFSIYKGTRKNFRGEC